VTYARFVWGSYAVFALALAGLAAWLLANGRRLQGGIAALEARGVRRRSDTSS
jgi:heme exporter protein D